MAFIICTSQGARKDPPGDWSHRRCITSLVREDLYEDNAGFLTHPGSSGQSLPLPEGFCVDVQVTPLEVHIAQAHISGRPFLVRIWLPNSLASDRNATHYSQEQDIFWICVRLTASKSDCLHQIQITILEIRTCSQSTA